MNFRVGCLVHHMRSVLQQHQKANIVQRVHIFGSRDQAAFARSLRPRERFGLRLGQLYMVE